MTDGLKDDRGGGDPAKIPVRRSADAPSPAEGFHAKITEGREHDQPLGGISWRLGRGR